MHMVSQYRMLSILGSCINRKDGKLFDLRVARNKMILNHSTNKFIKKQSILMFRGSFKATFEYFGKSQPFNIYVTPLVPEYFRYFNQILNIRITVLAENALVLDA